jgi:peptide/nickel transport system ATP-binding protein
MSAVLRINDLQVHYGKTPAVRDFSLELPAGKTVGLVGESGSGKTTVGRVVCGLLAPTRGEVILNGQVLSTKRSREEHRRIQMVFQDPDSSLNPRMTVKQMLSEALLFHKIVPRSGLAKALNSALARVQLDESALHRYPAEFSGGQRQRLVLARALSVQPEVLIADEPTSALDVSVQATVLELLRSLQQELALTVLFISHDLGVINAVSDRVAVMRKGTLVEVAEREAFFAAPQAQYSRALLAAVPRLETAFEGAEKEARSS